MSSALKIDRSHRNDPVGLHVHKIEWVSAHAIRCTLEGGADVWVPRSQVHKDNRLDYLKSDNHNSGTLMVNRWWAESRQLVER